MKKKTGNSELENRLNEIEAVETVAQPSASHASISSGNDQSEEDPEEELEEEKEDEKDGSELELEEEEDPEEEIEEEQEVSKVGPETDQRGILEEDSSPEPEEEDPDADPSEEDPDEDPSEVDTDEDPSEEDPEEHVSPPNSENRHVPDDNQRPADATKSLSQGYKSKKEKCRYKEVLKQEISFRSAVSNESGSADKEPPGKSQKQRRSRWEPQLEDDKKSTTLDMDKKRRKTRWDVGDSQLTPNSLKDFASDQFDRKVQQMISRLKEINNMLQVSKFCEKRPEAERSLSPEARIRNKLTAEKQSIIDRLSKRMKVSTTDNSEKLCKKLYIPVKEYPTYNFMGLILGPQGNTLRKMEKQTRAKILLRGKGSEKGKVDSSDEEDLHALIIASKQESLDAAVAMVEKLLVPVDDYANEHKLAQLKELAQLRGNYVDKNTCRVCWEQGHQDYACPQRPSTFKVGIPPQNSTVDALRKPKKEIDYSNLYVGYLPKVVDDSRLREIFSPFGKIVSAIVMKDITTGVSKGYGFVKFVDVSDATTAMTHMNKHQMDGHMLAVRVAGIEPQVAVFPPPTPLPPAPSYPGGMNQVAWPGQPSSMYYGYASQYPVVGSTNATPPLFISGAEESKADSGLLAKFPGDPDYPGSEFKSYFNTGRM